MRNLPLLLSGAAVPAVLAAALVRAARRTRRRRGEESLHSGPAGEGWHSAGGNPSSSTVRLLEGRDRSRDRDRDRDRGRDEWFADELGAILVSARTHASDGLSDADRRQALTDIHAAAQRAVTLRREGV